jgi:hypothetical protein
MQPPPLTTPDDLLRELALLGTRMTAWGDEGKDGRARILSQARRLALSLRSPMLELVPKQARVRCYLFRKFVNDFWRHFGGDVTSDLPIEEENPLTESVIPFMNALGELAAVGVDGQDDANMIVSSQEIIESYLRLLSAAETMLAKKGAVRT